MYTSFCAHGLRHPGGKVKVPGAPENKDEKELIELQTGKEPLKRDTRMDATFNLSAAVMKKCRGHRGRPHFPISGTYEDRAGSVHPLAGFARR